MPLKAFQFFAGLLVTTGVFAADPWIGSWKMNVAESKFPRTEVEITLQNGAYHVRPSLGTPRVLVPDGQFRQVDGVIGYDTVSLRRVGDRAMEEQRKIGDAVVWTARWSVSADGKRTTQEVRETDADGSIRTSTLVSDRLSGADKDPFVGRWVWNAAASTLADRLMTYKAEGDSLVYIDGRLGYSARFDGKEYPMTGRRVPETVVIKRLDVRTLEETFRRDGKISVTSVSRVATDGKKMTVTNTMPPTPGGKEGKVVMVFYRQ